MTSREIVDAVLKDTGVTQAQAAKRIGLTPQQFNARLMRATLKADELINLLDAVGVELSLTNKETGKSVRPHILGAGRRLKGMSGGVKYDTAAADALANNFYADGVNEYTDGKALELYIDSEGRYFFAEYTCWEGGKDRIVPVTAHDAAAFIEKYGMELFRKPKE